MSNFAAVTICSVNYMSKALVLFETYKKNHPDHDFFVVLVDRRRETLSMMPEGLSLIWAEELPIDNFYQAAFAFDVIEFNTNVKPAAMKLLLKNYEAVVYLDPDIEVFSPLDPVFDALSSSPIVLTPHYNTPIIDGFKPDDLELLKFGAFNLGFAGVSRSDEAIAFLDWWSARCLEYGYYEPQLGLAVDQKWVTIAPAYFPNLRILHDVGLNLAFWNLHERHIERKGAEWYVNGDVPLRFVHFSSFSVSSPESIAQKQNRFAPGSRPDFELIAREYAAKLIAMEAKEYAKQSYGFDYFDDGTYVTPALRRFYAALKDSKFANVSNPFEANGPVQEFARKNGLLVKKNAPMKRHNFHDINAYSGQIKIINIALRMILRILGPERYFNLMRYAAHISSLRNQADIFKG